MTFEGRLEPGSILSPFRFPCGSAADEVRRWDSGFRISIEPSPGGLAFVGTPATIADGMQRWLEEAGCDGFNIMFPYLPGGLDNFVDKVVPELQARGLFRTEYEGVTLRENLGLHRPPNRFFP